MQTGYGGDLHEVGHGPETRIILSMRLKIRKLGFKYILQS